MKTRGFRTEDFRDFAKKEDGAITAFGLFLLMTSMAIAGLAIDVSHAYLARTQLQNAADTAAHAAIMKRETETPAGARASAIQMANAQLAQDRVTSALYEDDIKFGFWNAATNTFQIDENSTEGVMVTTNRLADRSNGVGTFMLKFAGFGNFDVRSSTVFLAEVPGCLTEGFVGVGHVDMQSNNDFSGGFCIHSNSSVSFNNNNNFEDGTTVSMPNLELLEIPGSGFSSNPGLEDALREGYYNIRILNHIENIIDDMAIYGSDRMPDYIHQASKVTLTKTKNLTSSDFTQNAIHQATCSGNQSLSIKAGETLSEIVIVTNCKVSFGSGVKLEDVVVATYNDSAKSITGASGVQVGEADGCAAGGGSQLVTMGGMEFPSKLSLFGGQLLAKGDISFAANANGIMGASIISGGEIDGTSNTAMGHCASAGMEDNFEMPQFRMAI